MGLPRAWKQSVLSAVAHARKLGSNTLPDCLDVDTSRQGRGEGTEFRSRTSKPTLKTKLTQICITSTLLLLLVLQYGLWLTTSEPARFLDGSQ